MVMVPNGTCISALSHRTSKENDNKARFFPCLLHQNMLPNTPQLARDRKVPTLDTTCCVRHIHRDPER